MQGAGGVDGLLKLTYYGTSTINAFGAYNGNGNVTALIEAANGSVCARYEYGPFAEPIRSSGPLCKLKPICFSTKYTDTESGFLYYGYRCYNSSTGRWLNRDTVGELGGVNVLSWLVNDAANHSDAEGWFPIETYSEGRAYVDPALIYYLPWNWSKLLKAESGVTCSTDAWFGTFAEYCRNGRGICNSGDVEVGASSFVSAFAVNPRLNCCHRYGIRLEPVRRFDRFSLFIGITWDFPTHWLHCQARLTRRLGE